MKVLNPIYFSIPTYHNTDDYNNYTLQHKLQLQESEI